jgi:DNA-directed RNA polymerase specialized sigma24 family protein
MDHENLDKHLSRISTLWTEVLQAHADPADAATAARGRLLQRYGGAVHRYLLGAVRDPDVAAELAQEFALRLVRGDFRRADPVRGRFRDYVKVALIHLVTDHHRARQAWPRQLAAGGPDPAAPALESADSERDFLAAWREELLERTWQALTEANAAYHAALLLRIQSPDLSSAQMAEELSARLGRPLTADWVRKALQRAQARFADLLLEEVATSLGGATDEQLREELGELDLLRYCRSALERRGPGG